MLSNAHLQLRIGEMSGLPVSWRSCEKSCGVDESGSRQLIAAKAGSLQWDVPGDELAKQRLQAMRYELVASAVDQRRISVRSAERYQGRFLTHRYELAEDGHSLRLRLDIPAGTSVTFTSGPQWIPEQLPGFGAIYGDVWPVIVGRAGQDSPELDGESPFSAEVAGDQWSGVRNRFWAFLLKAEAGATLVAEAPEQNRPTVRFTPGATGAAVSLQMYGGPVEWESLARIDSVPPWDVVRRALGLAALAVFRDALICSTCLMVGLGVRGLRLCCCRWRSRF